VQLRHLKRKFSKLFFREQWSLLVCNTEEEVLVNIVPPKNYIWADPFPVETGQKTYIFIEQQIGYNNGTIGYIELYPDLTYSKFIPVLEKNYHLSFPNVFCIEQNNIKIWYMIPESHENKTIDVYRATSFPTGWVYEATLMSNVSAVDSVVFFHDSRWWLFTSIGSETVPVNRNFSAFYSDNFPSTTWNPHPQNPLYSDWDNSRMAGNVFFDKRTGFLNRPAQSCKKEYGEKIHINEILELNTASYCEKKSRTILPEHNLHAVCTHTINYSNTYMLRDIKTRRLRVF
jgi:hypothetical protein